MVAMRIFEFDIPSIVCPACVNPIETELRKCKGVQNINVDVISKKAIVTTIDDELNYESLFSLTTIRWHKCYPLEYF